MGVRRIFFAALATILRAVARVPLGIGRAVSDLADACEERSR